MASLERVDATAKRLGVGRARVVDALVRVVPESELDAAVLRMVDLDAQALTAWRESSTPS
jgi:hypothetical protein